MKALFMRGIHFANDLAQANCFHRDPADFHVIPKSPFAYWASDAVFELFKRGETIEFGSRVVRIGMTTHDDFRWLRSWWEVTGVDARPLSKGGSFARFYRDLDLCVLWFNDGRDLVVSKAERFRLGELTENNSKLWNRALYGAPGLTWTRRSQAGFSMRCLPRHAFFGDKGPAILDSSSEPSPALLYLLAICNSAPYRYLLALQMAFGSFEIGSVRRTPLPTLFPSARDNLSRIAHRGWSARRSLDTAVEISHAFVVPALLQADGGSENW
jgi:hypothetical protein